MIVSEKIKMRLRWIFVWLSAAALVGGFGMLLIFINMFAVPHMLTGEFQDTLCKLTCINIKMDTEQCADNQTLCNLIKSHECLDLHHFKPQEKPKLKSLVSTSKLQRGEISKMYKLYVNYDKESVSKRIENTSTGIKYNINKIKKNLARNQSKNTGSVAVSDTRPVLTAVTAVTAVTDLEHNTSRPVIGRDRRWWLHLGGSDSSFCVSLQVSYKTLGGDVVKDAGVFESSWTFYDVIYGDSKCWCPSCQLHVTESGDVTVTLPGVTLAVGEHFPCLYDPFSKNHILAGRKSIFVVLNLMFWPTVVFVTGFVGLVFACLFVQRDSWTDCHCNVYNIGLYRV